MPKNKVRSKKNKLTKQQCKKNCKSSGKGLHGKGLHGKEKRSMVKLCMDMCLKQDKAYLLPKDVITSLLKTTIVSPTERKNIQQYLNKLPSTQGGLEKTLDEIYNQCKKHYIPIILDLQKDKSLFK